MNKKNNTNFVISDGLMDVFHEMTGVPYNPHYS